jgi:hypothetical protein
MQKLFCGIAAGLLLLSASIASAEENNNSAVTTSTITQQSVKDDYTLSEITPAIFSKLNDDQKKNIADQWHLSVEDYTHYLQLMNNTPNGVYYKDRNLDPSWILGFNAKDEQERQKYVVIAIQNERARIEKELAFQRDFTQLQRQLYPNQNPVNWTDDEIITKPAVAKK